MHAGWLGREKGCCEKHHEANSCFKDQRIAKPFAAAAVTAQPETIKGCKCQHGSQKRDLNDHDPAVSRTNQPR
ncbi:hypothetical protein D3C80_1162740 [compost metagenome]